MILILYDVKNMLRIAHYENIFKIFKAPEQCYKLEDAVPRAARL